MGSKNCTILVLSDDAEIIETVSSCRDELHYNLISTDNHDDALQYSKNENINIAIIDTGIPEYAQYIHNTKQINSDFNAIVICNESDFINISKLLKNHVNEFIQSPVKKIDLTLAFNRLNQLLQLQKKMQHANEQIELLKQNEYSKIIYNEKLLTIQQIVENMSGYIEKIAEHVQGGIKYFNELPYCVSIHDNNQKVLSVNNTYEKYFGNKTGNGSWEIFDGKYGSQNCCPVGVTIQTGAMFSGKCSVNYHSGASVPVFVHTTPVFSSNGEIEFILEVFAGTQEIAKMSKDVKATQQNYHQLFDAVPSYIAVLNRNNTITEINRSFKKEFGEQTGRSFFEVLNPGSIPADTDPISKVLRSNSPHQGEMVLTSENGKQYNMMTWVAPITTPTGKLLQVLVVLADKTEMRNLKDNLSSLGLMLGTLSHNLKGSLTGLDAGLYLIDTGFYRDKHARIEEGLDVSKLMVDRIRKMIFNILYYAKERELNLSNTYINQFAGDVAAHVENRILGGNISFVCDFPSKDIYCNLDSELLRSALINILENAREVCISDQADKSYEITFKVFARDSDLVFEIYDNGSGMDAEQQEQLFSIFSSSKGLQGTGLGLYITNEVIKKHNGTITVTSESGEGTCFSIKIPTTLQQKIK